MNILILGGGGREHALCSKFSQSSKAEKIWVSPGNAGTDDMAHNVSLNHKDAGEIRDFLVKRKIGLLVIGPEAPLVDGLADQLQAMEELKGVRILGPGGKGAQLEGSKSFAKEFMARHQIPTADYREFTAENLSAGLTYLDEKEGPYVLKADGLAGGKGVIITNERNEAKKVLKEMLKGKFGKASKKVVIEEFLAGIEFSVFVLTNGESYLILPEAKDYKRIGEGDTGPNTGGMGSVSPVPFYEGELKEKVRKEIIERTLKGLQAENIPYCGFIFFGLIAVNGNPYVIEYNCRLGDPETQVVLPRIQSDLLNHIISVIDGKAGEPIEITGQAAAAVITASAGYPGTVEKGKPIVGLEEIRDSTVFHAGTIKSGDAVLTNGGRVLAICSLADKLETAIEKSYDSAKKICYEGIYYRRDIGRDVLN
jgi:phosphoribosylamine---glycine ligase